MPAGVGGVGGGSVVLVVAGGYVVPAVGGGAVVIVVAGGGPVVGVGGGAVVVERAVVPGADADVVLPMTNPPPSSSPQDVASEPTTIRTTATARIECLIGSPFAWDDMIPRPLVTGEGEKVSEPAVSRARPCGWKTPELRGSERTTKGRGWNPGPSIDCASVP